MRPVTDQPSAVRRATVAGRPPRAGVPSSGSTRKALISAPDPVALRPSCARSASGQAALRTLAARWVRCIASTSAVEAQPTATLPTTRAVSVRLASAPPSWRRAVSASRPAACRRAKFSNGKLPSRSCAAAACANWATRAGSGSCRNPTRPSIMLAPGTLASGTLASGTRLLEVGLQGWDTGAGCDLLAAARASRAWVVLCRRRTPRRKGCCKSKSGCRKRRDQARWL